MHPRFDIQIVQNRHLVLGAQGCHDAGSRFVDAVLQAFALTGRSNYRHFFLSYMNFETEPGEDPWSWLFEPREVVQARLIAWLRSDHELEVRRSGHQEVTFDVIRTGGPINYNARAWAVLRKAYDLAATPEYRLRAPLNNPLCFDCWEAWSPSEKWDHCVRRYGLKIAQYALRYAGGFFIPKNRMVYSPPCIDPENLGNAIHEAVVARLGEHPIADMTGVGRDDGPRPEDIRLVTFADYADSGFGCEFIGSNKCGPTDEVGNRLPSKAIAFSPGVRDAIHRRIDSAHDRNPALPSMSMLRRMLEDGNRGELAKWYVFAKPGTNEPYSYRGIHDHVSRSTAKAGVTIRRFDRDMPATMRWQRRSLHDREYAQIIATSATKREELRRLAELTEERGHKSDQHDNYASWSRWKRVQKLKNDRIVRDTARREGRVEEAMNPLNVTLSPTRIRLAKARRRAS